MISISSPVSTS